jgi:hypothetical protein
MSFKNCVDIFKKINYTRLGDFYIVRGFYNKLSEKVTAEILICPLNFFIFNSNRNYSFSFFLKMEKKRLGKVAIA